MPQGPALSALLTVMSINVTALTRQRLQEALTAAEKAGCSAVALQETRHPFGGFRWANDETRKRGWRAQWSAPPPPTATADRRQGGVAVFWRPELGKGAALPAECDDWRTCGRRWSTFSLVSAYGDASSRPRPEWLRGALGLAAGQSSDQPAAVVGDINWKPAYGAVVAEPWSTAPVVPTTTVGTAPTRAALRHCEAVDVRAAPLAGVPHHLAVFYTFGVPAPRPAPAARLTRTARYDWQRPLQPPEEAVVREAAERRAADFGPCLSSDGCLELSLASGLQRWHAQAEAAFRASVALGAAAVARQAERDKGTTPSSRAAAASSRHRDEESIASKRLRRLHRGLQEAWRRGTAAHEPLPPCLQRRWLAAERDGLVGRQPAAMGKAADLLSRAMADQDAIAAKAAIAGWRSKFKVWTKETVREGAKRFKPGQPPLTFSAADMRDEWARHWDPSPAEGDQPLQRGRAWQELAAEVELPARPQRDWAPPPLDDFLDVARGTRGSAGLDGWEASELHAMADHMPWLLADLLALLTAAARSATQGGWSETDRQAFYAWRVVGIPKRGCDDSRPISVGSVLARAWHAALFADLPEPEPEQWAERGVVRSTASWAAAPGKAGAEVDMSKAYDAISHDAAAAALRHLGTPEPVVACAMQAWRAPRLCCVAGLLADPISPTSGLPAGDPLSTRVLGAMLAPWHRAIRQQCPGAQSWAYVDDRSLKGAAAAGRTDQEVVDDALALTAALDARVGFTENLKKRQRWQDDGTAEHLGIRAAPAAADPPLPAPRDGWGKVETLTETLRTLPGGIEVRQRLGVICVASTYRWAAPFVEVPPASLVASTFSAIANTRCSWWCRRRFWADRVAAHPQYGTAIHALRAAAGLPDSPLLRAAVAAHAGVLRLVPVWGAGGRGVWLRPAHGLDERAAAAARAAAPANMPFDASSERGQHVLRVCARAALLQPAVPSRRRWDEESIEAVDIEASSAPEWAEWRGSLSRRRRALLAIWRGGAVWTRTRRWRRGEEEQRCPWCPRAQASARHWWAECVRFDSERARLGADFRIAPEWWARQPRVTAKTGWVTLHADPSARRRAQMQIASCVLGIAVCEATAPDAG